MRPSYFEVSLLGNAGGRVSDHKTGGYSASLALALKAQFVRSRVTPGGAEGALALASELDLEATLLVRPLQGSALKDGVMKVEAISKNLSMSEGALKRRDSEAGSQQE